jgi:hypothetical protein
MAPSAVRDYFTYLASSSACILWVLWPQDISGLPIALDHRLVCGSMPHITHEARHATGATLNIIQASLLVLSTQLGLGAPYASCNAASYYLNVQPPVDDALS